MPDKVSVDEERGLIAIESFGRVTKEDILESFDRILELRETRGLDRVLVDTTKQEEMPNRFGIYNLFSNVPRDFRMALVAKPEQATSDELSFVETVSVNRGARMQLFTDREAALEWLGVG